MLLRLIGIASQTKGYREFHHWGVSTKTFDRDVARYEAMGHQQAFYGEIAAASGYIELFEVTPEFEKMNYTVYSASRNWDGKTMIYKG